MVFVVSGICGATAQEGFDEAYAEVETVLSSQANGEGLKLHTIGIAVDPLVEDGLAVLRRFGPFDEILAGAGWENGMSLHYLFGDLSVLPTVPQLLVFRRSVVPENRTLLIMQDTLLFALRGLEEIVHFSQHGLPPGRQSQ